MNYVEIKLDENSNELTCYINDEKISKYNDLSTIINGSLTSFVKNIFQRLDDEIFDNYEITYYGLDFVFLLLSYNKQKSEYCKKLHFIEINGFSKINQHLKELQMILEKYNSNVSLTFDKQNKFYSELELNGKINSKYINDVDAEVIITNQINLDYKYNIIIDDKINIDENRVIIIYLPIEKINLFMEYYNYNIEMENFKSIINQLKNIELSLFDKKKITYITEGIPQYILSEIPSVVDVGEKNKYLFISIPENYFSIKFYGEVLFTDDYFIGDMEGDINLTIKDIENKVFYEQSISIVSHKYVQEIRLVDNNTNLIVNQKYRLELLFIPEDAEDINQIEYIFDNDRKAIMSKLNEIIPLESGSVNLTIKAKKIEKIVNFNIKEQLEVLEFEKNNYTIENGKSIIITLKLPSNNVDCSHLEWSFDNLNIAHITPSIEHDCCKVIASSDMTGTGNLKCFDPITQKTKYCNITVTTPPKSPLGAIIIFVVIFLLLMVCCTL